MTFWRLEGTPHSHSGVVLEEAKGLSRGAIDGAFTRDDDGLLPEA